MNKSLDFLVAIGSLEYNQLVLNIDRELTRVRISLEDEDYLNFSHLSLIGVDGKISVEDVAIVSSSSVHESVHHELIEIISGKGFHTKKEPHPYLEITFTGRTSVKAVVIRNRNSRLSGRIISLKVEGWDDEAISYSFRNLSVDNCILSLQKINHQISTLVPDGAVEAVKQLYGELNTLSGDSSIRDLPVTIDGSVVKSEIVAFVESNFATVQNRGDVVVLLLAILDRPSSVDLVSAIDYRCLVLALAVYLTFVGNISSPTFRLQTHVVSFGDFLRSLNSYYSDENELTSLQKSVQDKATELGSPLHPIIGRHGWRDAVLISKKTEYLDGIARTLFHLESMGVLCFLAYGTLLGAVREGGFIPHDDDVDLFIYMEIDKIEDLLMELTKLASRLSEEGVLRVKIDPVLLILQVDVEGLSIGIDLFPAVYDRSSKVARCHHRGMEMREIGLEILVPPSLALLYGLERPAPAKQEEFLRWRYGESWQTPQQFFEMQWIFGG